MSPPHSIAHYRILSKLGEGGMGAVYRAADTKLNREVAIKVLPPAFAEDPARMQRFEREAQVLASLNHSNIAAIYGIEAGAIVMELVDGDDLQGPVPIDTAIAYARQIAAGLEAAHEKGIIHRDLKPANIKVTHEGVVKLLDFGLAKATEQSAVASAAASPTLSPTLSLAMTQAGMILGTAAYMAPEQARGKVVDRRADIWAFGVVLFELLSGTMLFASGDTVTDIIAAVVTREPDWKLLPADTPPHIRRLLERCLRKDPKLRLQAIGEARIALDEPVAEAHAAPAVAPARGAWGWVAAGLLAAALALVLVLNRHAPPAGLRPTLRFESDEVGVGGSPIRPLALSPDGTRVVFDGAAGDGSPLMMRLLDQPDAAPLLGSEGAGIPVFSPDGEWLAFASGGKLRKLSMHGGAPIILCDAPATLGIDWGDDGSIVFAPGTRSPIMRVSSTGGIPKPVTHFDTTRGEVTHRFPWMLPGGKIVVYTASTRGGMYNDAFLVAANLETGRSTLLRKGGFHPMFAARPDGDGYLLFVQQDTLYAMPMDPVRLTVREPPVPMILGLNASISSAYAAAALARSGLFAFGRGLGVEAVTLSWIDAAGKPRPLRAPGLLGNPSLSPDGKRILFRLAEGENFDFWVHEVATGTTSKLTFNGHVFMAVWTPDGRHILYSDTAGEMWWLRSDGSGTPHSLGKLEGVPGNFTPDGRILIVGIGGKDLATLRFEDPSSDDPRPGTPEIWQTAVRSLIAPALSPDGKWAAYVSNETGRHEVYVRPFPGPGGQWQVTHEGGEYPQWSPRGGELYYTRLFPGQEVHALSYKVQGEAFVAQAERSLGVKPSGIYSSRNYAVAPDGKQIVALLPRESAANAPKPRLNYLVNFVDELQRRVTAAAK